MAWSQVMSYKLKIKNLINQGKYILLKAVNVTYPISAIDITQTIPLNSSPIDVNVMSQCVSHNGKIISVTQPTIGNSSFTDNNIQYIPPSNLAGIASFQYTISDGASSSVGNVYITINSTSPVAVDDHVTCDFSGSVVIDVLANDITGGEPITRVVATNPTNGRVVVNSNKTITYSAGTVVGSNSIYVDFDLGLDTNSGTITNPVQTIYKASLMVPNNGVVVIINKQYTITSQKTGRVAWDWIGCSNKTFTLDFNYAFLDISLNCELFLAFLNCANATVTIKNLNMWIIGNTIFENGFIGGGTYCASSGCTMNVSQCRIDGNFGKLAYLNCSNATITISFCSVLTVYCYTNYGSYNQSNNAIINYTKTQFMQWCSTVLSDVFTYTIYNNKGSSSAKVYLSGTPIQAPTAGIYSITLTRGTSITFDPRSVCNAGNGLLVIDSVSAINNSSMHGTAVVNNFTSITYTADAHYAGSDSFNYTIDNGHGTSVGLINVTINGVAPTAVNDTVSVVRGKSITFNPTTNDDNGGVPITLLSVGQGYHGTVTNNGDNTLTYVTNDAIFIGTDDFTYIIKNQYGSSQAIIFINITPSALIAVDDYITVYENSSSNFFDPRLNDDGGGESILSIIGNSSPSHGSALRTTSDGWNYIGIYYTPTHNYIGSDNFTYTIKDAIGRTATGTIHVTVVVPPPPPTAVNDSITVTYNTEYTFDPTVNDSGNGYSLSVFNVSTPSHGSIVLKNNNITYTPSNNYVGADTFTYKINNGYGTATATVNVSVIPGLPVAIDDFVTIAVNNSSIIDVMANDNKSGASTISIDSITQPYNGAVVINNDGTLTYTPTTDYIGSDLFTYTIRNTIGTDTANVNVTVTATPPDAVDDILLISRGSYKVINPRINDNGHGLAITIISVTQGTYGVASVVNNGAFIKYDLTGIKYVGPDSFTYTIQTAAGTSTANVWVEIDPVLPTAIGGLTFTVYNDKSITFDPTINDDDGGGGSLSISFINSQGAGVYMPFGTYSYNSTLFTYNGDSIHSGTITVFYKITNSVGESDAASFTINVEDSPLKPVATNDSITVEHNSSLVFDPTLNDDGKGLSLSYVSLVNGGVGHTGITTMVGSIGSNTLTCTASTSIGTDQFTYTITNGHGQSTGLINVTVIPTSPIAHDFSLTIARGETTTIYPCNLCNSGGGDLYLTNNTSSSSHGITKTNHFNDGVSEGTLKCQAYQVYNVYGYYDTWYPNIIYVSDGVFIGTDSFTYVIYNSVGTDIGTVNINIIPNAPTAGNYTLQLMAGTSNTLNKIASNDGGHSYTVTSISSALHGTMTTDNNTITYTCNNSTYYGSDTFTYVIDNTYGTSTGSVNVTITEALSAPSAIGDTSIVVMNYGEASYTFINVLANDFDGGEPISIISYTQPSNGSAELYPNNHIKYSPNFEYTGADSFTYTIANSIGSSVGNVNITVNYPPPVAVSDSFSMDYGSIHYFDPTLNDIGYGLPITLLSVSEWTFAYTTATIEGNLIKFNLTGNPFTGPAYYNYSIQTSAGISSGSITVTVNPVTPVAHGVTNPFTVIQNNTIVFNPTINDDNGRDAIHISAVDTPTNGTVSFSGTTVTYHANSTFVGQFSLNYTITNTKGSSSSTFLINAILHPLTPVAVNDSISLDRGGNSVTFNPTVNDDVKGQSFIISAVTQGSYGSVTNNNDDTLTYTCTNATYVGSDSFTYTIDNGIGTSVGSVSVTIKPVLPTAHNYEITMQRGQSIIKYPCSDGLSDSGGGILVLTGNTSSSTYGTVLTSGGVVTSITFPYFSYTSNSTYIGDDSFTYTISNSIGNSTGTVTLHITANPPTAANHTVHVPRGGSVSIDLLANSSNGGEPFNISHISEPSHGTYSSGVYTCNDSIYLGSDNFNYTLTNSIGSSTGNVTITVNPSSPNAVDDTITTSIYSEVLWDVLLNDDDGGAGYLTIQSCSTPIHGSVEIVSIPNYHQEIRYTNTDGHIGQDLFSYTITNGIGTDVGMVYINLTPSSPVAVDDVISVKRGQSISFDPRINDNYNRAPYMEIIAVNSNSLPVSLTYGNISLNANGSLTYDTTNLTYIGTETCTYTIRTYNDNNGIHYYGTAVGNITINIVPIAPTATDQTFHVSRGGSVTFDPTIHDDTGGNSVSIVSTSQGTYGDILINDTQLTYTYTGDIDVNSQAFPLTDTFTYTIINSVGSSSATITMIIDPVPPTPNSCTITTRRSGSVAFESVLDKGGAVTRIVSLANGTHGTNEITTFTNQIGDLHQAITFSGNGTYVGTDTFLFVVSNVAGSATGSVTVNIIPDAPTAVDDTLLIFRNTSGLVDAMVNDNNGGDTISITSFTSGVYGIVTLENGKLRYTPSNPYYIGTDTFTYTISNSTGSDTGNVFVTVAIVPPTASDDNITVNRGSYVIFDPRVNDDTGGGILAITNETQGIHGVASVVNGLIKYTCDTTKYIGTDNFAYTISNVLNEQGGTSTASVYVNIIPIAPVASDVTINLYKGTNLTFSTTVDDGGEQITTTNTNPSHGTVLVNTNQTLKYTCNDNVYIGTDTFTYTVTNSKGSSTANVNVVIVPSPPIATDDTYSVKFAHNLAFDPTTNDDNGGGTLSLAISTSPQYGIANNSGTQITYIAPTNYNTFQYTGINSSGFYYGNDTFKYTISNVSGSSVGNITMSVWTDQLVLFYKNTIAGNGLLGKSISIDNNIMVVGSPGETVSGLTNAGAIYIYEKNSSNAWVQTAKFTAPVVGKTSYIGANYQFGYSVSISNDFIVVGAPFETSNGQPNAGAVYVYMKGTNWTYNTRFAATSVAGQKLGYTISTYYDGTIRWYATNMGTGGSGQVVVRKYASSVWSTSSTISSILASNISLYNNQMLVVGSNTVYLYTFGTTWTLTRTVTTVSDQYNVSLANDRYIVGSPSTNKAYIYKLNGTLEATIDHSSHPGYSSGDSFGYSVSMDRYFSKYVIIGCPNFNSNSGKIYIYEFDDTSWVSAGSPEFVASSSNVYGTAVCMNNKRVAVGSPGNNTNNGAIYFYE